MTSTVFPSQCANLVYSAAVYFFIFFCVLHRSGHTTKLLQDIHFCLGLFSFFFPLYHCVLIEQEGGVQRKKTWFSCIYSLSAFIPHNRLVFNHQREITFALLCACVCHGFWTHSDDPEIPVSINAQHCTLTNHFLSEDHPSRFACLSLRLVFSLRTAVCLTHLWCDGLFTSSYLSLLSLSVSGATVLFVNATDLDASREFGQASLIYSLQGSSQFRLNTRSGGQRHTHPHLPLTLMLTLGSHRPKALLNNSDNSQ